MMRGISFKIRPLTSESIASIQDKWIKLAQDSIEKNVFLLPWFVHASLELLRPHSPDLVTIYRDEELIGLAVMQPDQGYAKLPVRFFKNSTHYHQFLATPLIRTGHARDFFIGLGQWLDASGRDKSFCLLNLLSGDGEIAEAANDVFRAEGRASTVVDEFERAAIEGQSDPTVEADAHVNKSRLKSMRRRRKQLAKLGEVTVESFSAEDCALEWLEDFMRVEDSGWKGDAQTSIAKNSIDVDFYREMIAEAEATNSLTFLRLKLDGVAIAYTLDLVCDDFVYCLKCAHDVEFRKYSPGVILEHETLKKYHRPGGTARVDSCTSPENEMLNELWPHQRKVIALAFAKKDLRHEFAFKSVMRFKSLIGKRGALKRAGK